MRASVLVFPAVLLLAGCQSAAERQAAETGEIDVANASMEQVSALTKAARAKQAMQPGTWESGTELVAADFAAGPSHDAQMEAAAKIPRHAVKCQTAADLAPVDITMLEKVGGSCTFPRYVQKGGKIDVQIECAKDGAKTTLLYKGTMGKDAYDVAVEQNSGAPGQAGYAAVKMRVYGKRLGLCTGKPSA
jgi:uncharacterized protein YceK